MCINCWNLSGVAECMLSCGIEKQLTKPENFVQFNPKVINKIPHKCPVCGGTGKNPEVTTSHGAASHYIDACQACKGACVLWG
jgi:hypothetical protein